MPLFSQIPVCGIRCLGDIRCLASLLSATDRRAPGRQPAGKCVAREGDDWVGEYEPPGTLFLWGYGNATGGPPSRDEPLASDRPDFTEASTTVGRGVVQLEMGYTYFSDDDGPNHTHSHSYPELLARIGILAEWLEFRIAYNNASAVVQPAPLPSEIPSGSEDLYLGFKIGLTPQAGILPEMSLMPHGPYPPAART